MKFPFVVIVLLVLSGMLVSCKQGLETPPVSQEKMSRLLLDMQLAEAYSQGLGDGTRNRFEKNTDSLAGFYTSILKHHGMTFTQFEEALEWYKERPVLLDSVYNKALNQLIVIKAKRGIKDTDEPRPTVPDAIVPDSNIHKADVMIKTIAADTTSSKMDTASHLEKRFAPPAKPKS